MDTEIYVSDIKYANLFLICATFIFKHPKLQLKSVHNTTLMMQGSKHKSLQSTRTWYLPKQDEANGFYRSPSDIIVHVTHLDKDKHYQKHNQGEKMIACFNYLLQLFFIIALNIVEYCT